MAKDFDSTPSYKDCVMTSARMAARALTRMANKRLKPYGFTAPQLSLLGAINSFSKVHVSELAEELAIERTTLIRNLKLLEDRAFIESVEVLDHSRGLRQLRLTSKGHDKLEELYPLWQAFQNEIREQFGAENIENSVKTLRRLAGRE